MAALNPQVVPEDLRDRLANGVEARVPGRRLWTSSAPA